MKSLPFPSLPFPSLPFPSLPFPSLPFPSLPFPSLPFPSLPFPSLPFPSLPFPSLPFPSLPFPSLGELTLGHLHFRVLGCYRPICAVSWLCVVGTLGTGSAMHTSDSFAQLACCCICYAFSCYRFQCLQLLQAPMQMHLCKQQAAAYHAVRMLLRPLQLFGSWPLDGFLLDCHLVMGYTAAHVNQTPLCSIKNALRSSSHHLVLFRCRCQEEGCCLWARPGRSCDQAQVRAQRVWWHGPV